MLDKKHLPNEYRAATEILKRELKNRGFTYATLAKEIKLSESGVKKIFSASDGSFQRLAQICQVIGISLADLIHDQETVEVDFTEDQQKSFLKEPRLFEFYWMLVYERRPVLTTQDEMGLSKADCLKWLRKLDSLNLIVLLPGDRIRLPAIRAVRWTGKGEFLQQLYRKWASPLVEKLAKPQQKEGELFFLRYLQLTKETQKEFQAALKNLEQEFIRRSVYEMRTGLGKREHIRWLVAMDNCSYVTQKP